MRTALIACAIAIGSAAPLAASQHKPRNQNPNSHSPATPDCSVTIAIAATLRPTTSLRSKAASTSRTSRASILATGTRTCRRCCFNGASLEMDFYGGYKATFGDFGLDVGVLYYYYPGTGKYVSGYKPDFFEGYIGGTWGPLSLKYFYGFTDFFDLKAPGRRHQGLAIRRSIGCVADRRRLGHSGARRLAKDQPRTAGRVD